MVHLDDGYGDDPVRREMDYEEYIAENEGLLKLKAAERTRGNVTSSDTWDDLLQEGRIVQWTVLEKRPESARAYVSAAMSNRISECINRGTWTGLERTHGKPVDPIRRPLKSRDSVDDPDVTIVVSSGDWVDHVMMAYHHGEIMQALNELTFRQREYVFDRFWLGMSNPEIAARRGLSTGEVERQWRCTIRPHLVEKLVHLSAP
jgi:RNA polymerase sigma factor (sigma-70 family)